MGFKIYLCLITYTCTCAAAIVTDFLHMRQNTTFFAKALDELVGQNNPLIRLVEPSFWRNLGPQVVSSLDSREF